MIRPLELEAGPQTGPWLPHADDVWAMLTAAVNGDADSIRRLLNQDSNLYKAAFCYHQPLMYAVREGHIEAVRLLLEAGGDAGGLGSEGESLVTVARDRDYTAIATLLEQARSQVKTPLPEQADDPIHAAAARNSVREVRALLDADPQIIERGDRAGGTPLHRAVAASARDVVVLLLDRGANINALHGAGFGYPDGYAATHFQPVDLALWDGPYFGVRGDLDMARLLVARGAAFDVVIATALGEFDTVREMLDKDPTRVEETRPSGKRALSTAYQFGHKALAKFLLDRGADPNSSDGSIAPRGMSLFMASKKGDRELVDLLLSHGADPNGGIDSSGSATYVAATSELRALLISRGGKLDPYDLVWLGDDDQVIQRVREDPASANSGCGGVFTAACTQKKRDLVVRLLEAALACRRL